LAEEAFTGLSLAKAPAVHTPSGPPAEVHGFYDVLMSHTVVAELVAAVLLVEVKIGDTVAADDPVVILESMKMEIPVLAEVAGTVSEISVSAGDVVNDGDPLVMITRASR
jgi:acetyl-CoA carboxylase biotin carboxyl carrier protein